MASELTMQPDSFRFLENGGLLWNDGDIQRYSRVVKKLSVPARQHVLPHDCKVVGIDMRSAFKGPTASFFMAKYPQVSKY